MLEQQRAQPPRPPAPSASQVRAEAERRDRLQARVGLEQRSLLRGLIILAALVLVGSLWRAGFDRLFVPGWWRQW